MARPGRGPFARPTQDIAQESRIRWRNRTRLARINPISQRVGTAQRRYRADSPVGVVSRWVVMPTRPNPLPVYCKKRRVDKKALARTPWMVGGRKARAPQSNEGED